MPFRVAMETIQSWVDEVHDGKLKLNDPLDCPIQKWIEHNNKGCGKDMVAGIATCPICGAYVCPTCKNHMCTPLSRVTGYVAAVDGWNASKQQELQDRVRTQIPVQ